MNACVIRRVLFTTCDMSGRMPAGLFEAVLEVVPALKTLPRPTIEKDGDTSWVRAFETPHFLVQPLFGGPIIIKDDEVLVCDEGWSLWSVDLLAKYGRKALRTRFHVAQDQRRDPWDARVYREVSIDNLDLPWKERAEQTWTPRGIFQLVPEVAMLDGLRPIKEWGI